MKAYKVTTRSGREFTGESPSIDDYRFNQLRGQWVDAGLLFCRLGVPLPEGVAEVTQVRLEEQYELATD